MYTRVCTSTRWTEHARKTSSTPLIDVFSLIFLISGREKNIAARGFFFANIFLASPPPPTPTPPPAPSHLTWETKRHLRVALFQAPAAPLRLPNMSAHFPRRPRERGARFSANATLTRPRNGKWRSQQHWSDTSSNYFALLMVTGWSLGLPD